MGRLKLRPEDNLSIVGFWFPRFHPNRTEFGFIEGHDRNGRREMTKAEMEHYQRYYPMSKHLTSTLKGHQYFARHLDFKISKAQSDGPPGGHLSFESGSRDLIQ